MKKLIACLFASVMFFANPVLADLAIGVTANFSSIDTDGSETELSGDLEKTTASFSEDVVIPEMFVEAIADNGWTLGLAYVPVRELGTKTRTDTSPTADTETADAGDYKASAELESLVMLYTDIPIVMGTYIKLGVQRASLLTTESLDGGNDYDDADLLGYTVGAGYRGTLGEAFYKAEVSYTDFDEYSDISTSLVHKVVADTEITSVRLSAGFTF